MYTNIRKYVSNTGTEKMASKFIDVMLIYFAESKLRAKPFCHTEGERKYVQKNCVKMLNSKNYIHTWSTII